MGIGRGVGRGVGRCWLIAAMAGCAEVPLSPGAEAPGNVLAGQVVVTEGAASDTFVFLYGAGDPPPPLGLGAPEDFTGIAGSAFSAEGMPSAAFAIPDVERGVWLLTAIVDRDRDFRPYSAAYAGATCGDGVGALVDGDGAPEPLQVDAGEWAQGLTVAVGRTLTTERPVFTVVADPVDQVAAAAGAPVRLEADRVWAADLHLEGPLNPRDPEPCRTYFPVVVVDADMDGAPDPHPTYGDLGLVDVWPRVYFGFEGPGEGESWAAEAAIPPDPAWLAQPLNTPIAATSLDALFLPVARHTLPDGSAEQVQAPDLPAGRWSVTVISPTGQTWAVPNELAGVASRSPTWDPARQGVALEVR